MKVAWKIQASLIIIFKERRRIIKDKEKNKNTKVIFFLYINKSHKTKDLHIFNNNRKAKLKQLRQLVHLITKDDVATDHLFFSVVQTR